MSKIAEKKALEEYPLPKEESESSSFINQETFNSAKRTGYIKGYNQAIQDLLKDANQYMFLSDEIGYAYASGCRKTMQDFLEKACKWFESNLIDKEIVSMGIWHKFTDEDIEQFKNYMQDE